MELMALVLAASAVLGEEKAVDLKVGDAAPAFTAKDDAGKDWKSADHVGKKIVVVYFYPASFTGGCTKQACGFRDDSKVLTEKGIEVVGVSGDSVRTQELLRRSTTCPSRCSPTRKATWRRPSACRPGRAAPSSRRSTAKTRSWSAA